VIHRPEAYFPQQIAECEKEIGKVSASIRSLGDKPEILFAPACPEAVYFLSWGKGQISLAKKALAERQAHLEKLTAQRIAIWHKQPWPPEPSPPPIPEPPKIALPREIALLPVSELLEMKGFQHLQILKEQVNARFGAGIAQEVTRGASGLGMVEALRARLGIPPEAVPLPPPAPAPLDTRGIPAILQDLTTQVNARFGAGSAEEAGKGKHSFPEIVSALRAKLVTPA
jgi:hypothetical protein